MFKVLLKTKFKIIANLNLGNISQVNKTVINKKNIENIDLLYQNQKVKLKEIFSIEISKNNKTKNEIMIKGSNEFFDYLGYSWEKNILTTDSNVGCFAGAKMKSGEIVLNGSAADFLASEMEGGLIEVKSNVGDYLASSLEGSKVGMRGGQVIINGNVGKFSCFLMRRGLIIIKGNVDEMCCFQMIAGTVIIFKNVKKNLGISMKRGTIILMNSKVQLEKKFVKSGSINFNFLDLLKNYLTKNLLLNDLKKQKFLRYFGDKNIGGLGEVFVKEKL